MQSRCSNVQRSTHPRVRNRLRGAPGICALLWPHTPAHTATVTFVAVGLAYASAQAGFCSGKHAERPLVHTALCRLGAPGRRQRRLLGAP